MMSPMSYGETPKIRQALAYSPPSNSFDLNGSATGKAEENKMKAIRLFAFILAVCGAGLSTALAQELNDNDDGGGGGLAGVAAASARDAAEPVVQRYLVTYVKSRTDVPRSASVVTVTNQSNVSCEVKVDWFAGFIPDTPECTTSAVVDPGVTHDFCSRVLLSNVTSCNNICDPELSFTEGKAMVSSNARTNCGGLE